MSKAIRLQTGLRARMKHKTKKQTTNNKQLIPLNRQFQIQLKTQQLLFLLAFAASAAMPRSLLKSSSPCGMPNLTIGSTVATEAAGSETLR
jgi:hypothetical protein